VALCIRPEKLRRLVMKQGFSVKFLMMCHFRPLRNHE
jgi:hypothetical protein